MNCSWYTKAVSKSMSTVNIHQGYIKKLKSGVGVPLPDWAILFTVKEREDDLQLLSQVGAHEALHLDKEVVTAGLHGAVFLPVSMLHLNDTHRRNTVSVDWRKSRHKPVGVMGMEIAKFLPMLDLIFILNFRFPSSICAEMIKGSCFKISFKF